MSLLLQSSYSYAMWQLWILQFTECGSLSLLIMLLSVKLAKSLNFIPVGIINPKNPKEAPKSFSFDYSYWSHTSVSAFTRQPGFVVVWFDLTFSSDHEPLSDVSTVFVTHIQVKSLSLYVVFPCLGESRKLKQLVHVWKITENILQQCSVPSILRIHVCHGNSFFLLDKWQLLESLQFKGIHGLGFVGISGKGNTVIHVSNSCKSNKFSSSSCAPPFCESVLSSQWLPVIVLQQKCVVLPPPPPLPCFLKDVQRRDNLSKISSSNLDGEIRFNISEQICGQRDSFHNKILASLTEFFRAAVKVDYSPVTGTLWTECMKTSR